MGITQWCSIHTACVRFSLTQKTSVNLEFENSAFPHVNSNVSGSYAIGLTSAEGHEPQILTHMISPLFWGQHRQGHSTWYRSG